MLFFFFIQRTHNCSEIKYRWNQLYITLTRVWVRTVTLCFVLFIGKHVIVVSWIIIVRNFIFCLGWISSGIAKIVPFLTSFISLSFAIPFSSSFFFLFPICTSTSLISLFLLILFYQFFVYFVFLITVLCDLIPIFFYQNGDAFYAVL